MIYEGNKTKNISFPIGGIGTGSIGLAGNGSLIDWEIFNQPNKNSTNGATHFAIHLDHGEGSVTKILHGDTVESLMGDRDIKQKFMGYGFGPHVDTMAGYPHFREVSFDGEYPIARLSFADEKFPVPVRLCAFNPIIPHDDLNSSLPAAFFEWEVENTLGREISCTIGFSVRYPEGRSVHEEISEGGVRGIYFADAERGADHRDHCDLCVLTDAQDSSVQRYWAREGWRGSAQMFWRDISSGKRIEDRVYDTPAKRDLGAVIAYAKIGAGERKKLRFVLAWNAPNQYNYWSPYKDEQGNDVLWKNYYATLFENSMSTARYAIERFSELYAKTDAFRAALWGSSLPDALKDAAASSLSVLKSPTVMRLTDGSLWAWEGVGERWGSCEGSCQHVWNYAYALPLLFPKLERSLRENTMKYALSESGESKFRITLPVGREPWDHRACVDGQMGEVIKCYREWKISGDDEWLRAHAKDIFSMLEYAWSEKNPDRWDADKDGVIDGRQHHTLDFELFGANSWLEGFYLLALDCAAKMADALGDSRRAEEYREIYERGKKWTNEQLFNGRYFIHRIDLKDKSILDEFDASEDYWSESFAEIKEQLGEGCLIDQVIADWHAKLIGVDCVFDTEKRRSALESIYRYNFKESMRDVVNTWRIFAINDESGTLICDFPEDVERHAYPIPYTDECMTGFEYAFAGQLILNGYRAEGERVVRAVRDRYDGERRNPYNEIECGSNYARCMAAFAFLPIYSGMSFDMRRGHLGFAPILDTDVQYLWSIKEAWGVVRMSGCAHTLDVIGGSIELCSYGLPQSDKVHTVRADGKEVDFCLDNGEISFDKIRIAHTLEVIFG